MHREDRTLYSPPKELRFATLAAMLESSYRHTSGVDCIHREDLTLYSPPKELRFATPAVMLESSYRQTSQVHCPSLWLSRVALLNARKQSRSSTNSAVEIPKNVSKICDFVLFIYNLFYSERKYGGVYFIYNVWHQCSCKDTMCAIIVEISTMYRHAQ